MKLDTICISKHITKQAELLHPYINKARLTTCEVGVFYITTLENTPTPIYHTSQKYMSTPFFDESLKFITRGCIFERVRYIGR